MIKFLGIAVLSAAMLLSGQSDGCDESNPATAASDVKQQSIKVSTGSDGLTAEQRNVRDRLVSDNKPGSIKHLYVISAFSGQVILYSTVKGKVTSSGKRLTPTSVAAGCAYQAGCWGQESNVGKTPEVLQDDGTYGSSVEYLYWWDVQGRYHQHYVSGGQIVHISDQPIPVKSITINLEQEK